MSKVIKITDFAQDEKNFNKHTEKGMELLKKSIELDFSEEDIFME